MIGTNMNHYNKCFLYNYFLIAVLMIVFIHNAFISKVSGPHLLTVCAAENRVHGNSHASLAFINLEISVQSTQISR